MLGTNNPLVIRIRNMLAFNRVVMDNISISNEIMHINGVLQGDTLSPLLFNIAIAGIV